MENRFEPSPPIYGQFFPSNVVLLLVQTESPPRISDPICPVRDGFYLIHSVNGVGAGDVLKIRAGMGRGRGDASPAPNIIY